MHCSVAAAVAVAAAVPVQTKDGVGDKPKKRTFLLKVFGERKHRPLSVLISKFPSLGTFLIPPGAMLHEA